MVEIYRKNPHWLTENITLTPAGLKKLFDQTFDKGHDLGVLNGKAIAEKNTKIDSSDRFSSDFLNSILK